ncbi:MAG: penicillin-binding protein 2, partial [Treponema sp.]|nr:penicillin-binding protein 2 [Treponema sp.]
MPVPLARGEERPKGRIRLLQFLFIVVFVSYTLRLFSMQILNGEKHIIDAKDIARRTTVIPSQRGEIFDRHFNQPMALNTDSFAVSITPAEVPRKEMLDLFDRVAWFLDISREQIERKIPPNLYGDYRPVEVAVNVPFYVVAALAENVDSLPGLSWQSKPMRNYADTGSLSHVVGYVGDITRDELTMLYNRGYQQGDVIGKAGIERQYDELLRGKDGRETRTVDVKGRRVTGDSNVVREPPEMGKNLVLTID